MCGATGYYFSSQGSDVGFDFGTGPIVSMGVMTCILVDLVSVTHVAYGVFILASIMSSDCSQSMQAVMKRLRLLLPVQQPL